MSTRCDLTQHGNPRAPNAEPPKANAAIRHSKPHMPRTTDVNPQTISANRNSNLHHRALQQTIIHTMVQTNHDPYMKLRALTPRAHSDKANTGQALVVHRRVIKPGIPTRTQRSAHIRSHAAAIIPDTRAHYGPWPLHGAFMDVITTTRIQRTRSANIREPQTQ